MFRKILVFGAGVLGSLYAACLTKAGLDATVLARGRRLQEISSHGIILEHVFSGKRTVVPVKTVNTIQPSDCYDCIIVLVRKNQVNEVLTLLGSNLNTPSILMMVNNALGYQSYIEALGRERLMVGFAGAGGTLEEGVVRYALAPAFFQPTTLAELDGSTTVRLRELVKVFRRSGFPTTTSTNMDAWQKTHVAWISPLAQSIYKAERTGVILCQSRHLLNLTVEAIRESFDILESLGLPLMPSRLKLWQDLPKHLLVEGLVLWTRTKHFQTLILRHSLAARDEMNQIALEFELLAQMSGKPTPVLRQLLG